MRQRKWFGILSMMAFVGVVATSAFAATATNVRVSGPSPYASCTAGDVSGMAYVNAEVEPWVEVNPTTVKSGRVNLLGAWQQDRYSDGGARGLVAGYSFDGGKTWGRTMLPFSACVPGAPAYERATDPWISFGPDGTAYAVSVSFNNTDNSNAVLSATSTDGGRTWGNVQVIFADTDNWQYFSDKESVTADPSRAGVAYAVWDRLVSPSESPYAVFNAWAYKGPTWFARTTDHGKTWTSKMIFDPGQNNQTIGNQIVVDPKSGTLYNFFTWITSTGTDFKGQAYYWVAMQKSTDGGDTWSAPIKINTMQTVGVTHPNTGESVRTGDIIPEPAVDPRTGKLYVVWQDSRFNGGQYDEVAIASSSDGGSTWSAPVRVNKDAGRPAFTPMVRVNAAGVVGVSYYDFRNLAGETATLPTNVWFATSTDGGATFGSEAAVSAFDMKTAPNAGGYFVGDYQGLVTVGKSFHLFYAAANSGDTGNRTDILDWAVEP